MYRAVLAAACVAAASAFAPMTALPRTAARGTLLFWMFRFLMCPLLADRHNPALEDAGELFQSPHSQLPGSRRPSSSSLTGV